jgi:HTH-type transcriptional regulator, competence development regulator
MKLNITRAWLEKWLATTGGDSEVGAGARDLAHLKNEVTRRKVTPPALAGASNQLGKAVRFVREKRGWSVNDLARAADVDVAEIEQIESSESPELAPRTAIYLADALGFSRTRMQQFAGHLTAKEGLHAANAEYRFAARSKGTGEISDSEYDAIRALVAVLGERDPKD